MRHLGDITRIHNAPFVDCITFGSPCQDLSIAGRRAGLAGERSGLFMEAVRIIKEMREQSGGVYPTFAIWENVPGAFSSNRGRDFKAVLEELASAAEAGGGTTIPEPPKGKWSKAGYIEGDQWSIAWRTFDAQFWGVPQRRKRIALVVDFGGQRAGEILFEHTGVRRDSEPSIPPWQGVARNPAHRTAGHDRVVEAAGTLRLDNGNDSPFAGAESSPTIRPGAGPNGTANVAVCYSIGNGQTNQARISEKARALDCMHDAQAIVFRKATKPHNKSEPPRWEESEVCGTLNLFDTGESRANELVVFSKEAYNTGENASCSLGILMGETAPTMRADTHPSGVAYMSQRILRWITRRLTPTEYERLQGFPDGWTDIGEWLDTRGKRHKSADGPRYKALGNSIALPQWWWIICKMAAYLPTGATLGSLFDGIGGFPLVWEKRHGAGTALWASEIEEFPIAVTKRRFPES